MSLCRFSNKSDLYCWEDDKTYKLAFHSRLNLKEESYNLKFNLFKRLKNLEKNKKIRFPKNIYQNLK